MKTLLRVSFCALVGLFLAMNVTITGCSDDDDPTPDAAVDAAGDTGADSASEASAD